jgi:glycosyltransferase involved in cell wall biosynthesis
MAEGGKPHISIVIPTLNEGETVGRVITEVQRILAGKNYEILVIDGNSSDGTADKAERMGAKVIYENTGKGNALIKGLAEARGEVIVSMDADLSNEPKELNLLIDSIESGYDLCMGSRFMAGGGTEDMPLVRRMGNRAFVCMVNFLFGSNYSDMCYGYRSFKRNIVARLRLKETGFGIETEINIKAAKLKLRVMEIPSNEKPRNAGEPKLRTFKDGYVILATILRNILD